MSHNRNSTTPWMPPMNTLIGKESHITKPSIKRPSISDIKSLQSRFVIQNMVNDGHLRIEDLDIKSFNKCISKRRRTKRKLRRTKNAPNSPNTPASNTPNTRAPSISPKTQSVSSSSDSRSEIMLSPSSSSNTPPNSKIKNNEDANSGSNQKRIRKLSNTKILKKIVFDIDAALLEIHWIGVTNTEMIVGMKGYVYKIEMNVNTGNMDEIPNVYLLTRPMPNHINIDPETGRLSPIINDLTESWSRKGKYYYKVYNLLSNMSSIACGGSLRDDDILNERARWLSYDIVLNEEMRYGMYKNSKNYKMLVDFEQKRREWNEEQVKLEKIYEELNNGILFN